jgi:hypothetical protein
VSDCPHLSVAGTAPHSAVPDCPHLSVAGTAPHSAVSDYPSPLPELHRTPLCRIARTSPLPELPRTPLCRIARIPAFAKLARTPAFAKLARTPCRAEFAPASRRCRLPPNYSVAGTAPRPAARYSTSEKISLIPSESTCLIKIDEIISLIPVPTANDNVFRER